MLPVGPSTSISRTIDSPASLADVALSTSSNFLSPPSSRTLHQIAATRYDFLMPLQALLIACSNQLRTPLLNPTRAAPNPAQRPSNIPANPELLRSNQDSKKHLTIHLQLSNKPGKPKLPPQTENITSSQIQNFTFNLNLNLNPLPIPPNPKPTKAEQSKAKQSKNGLALPRHLQRNPRRLPPTQLPNQNPPRRQRNARNRPRPLRPRPVRGLPRQPAIHRPRRHDLSPAHARRRVRGVVAVLVSGGEGAGCGEREWVFDGCFGGVGCCCRWFFVRVWWRRRWGGWGCCW
jgi:hypothetical protein